MSRFSPQTIVVRKPVHGGRVQDDVVIFDDQAGQYFTTSAVGADIWDLIEKPVSCEDIYTWLTERYDVSREMCIAEVDAFIDELHHAGLIELN